MLGAKYHDGRSPDHLTAGRRPRYLSTTIPRLGYPLTKCLTILLSLPFLNGCVAIGIAGVEAAAIATGAVVAGTVATHDETKSRATRVFGNYGDEEGYWFDRELYYVSVNSESPEESERVARGTATTSCAKRKRHLQIVKLEATRDWMALFRPRFSFWIQFRCSQNAEGTS